MKNSATRFLCCFFLLLLFVAPVYSYYPGSDLGYIDYVTVNDSEFENFDDRQIVFYPEDLRDGAVIVRGLLESERKDIPVSELRVEISLDGGETWQRAKGSSRWEYQFRPEIERSYDFTLRVVRVNGDSVDGLKKELWRIGEFQL